MPGRCLMLLLPSELFPRSGSDRVVDALDDVALSEWCLPLPSDVAVETVRLDAMHK